MSGSPGRRIGAELATTTAEFSVHTNHTFPLPYQLMGRKPFLVFGALCLVAATCASSGLDQIRILGPQGVNLWQLDNLKATRKSIFSKDTEELGAQKSLNSEGSYKKKPQYEFPAQWFRQPLDHFDKHSKESFHQRYWVSTRHYKPRKGAPVIVLDGGETSGEVSICICSFFSVRIHAE